MAMPVSIRALFAAVGLEPGRPVPWREKVLLSEPGVYVVSLTPDLDLLKNTLRRAPISPARLADWMNGVSRENPSYAEPIHPPCLDGAWATEEDLGLLADRLSEFWLPEEVVLYVGSTTRPVKTRVKEYYDTPLGAKKKHSGGYFVKTLDEDVPLWVFFAEASEPARTEARMLAYFWRESGGLPFANLKYVKPHGIGRSAQDGSAE